MARVVSISQQRDLFAPALSRRPTSRANPRTAGDVLADPADSEEEVRQSRKTRLGSPPPELKYSRRRGRAAAQEEDGEIVVRRAKGEFLLDGSKADEALEGEMGAPELVAEREEASTYLHDCLGMGSG